MILVVKVLYGVIISRVLGSANNHDSGPEQFSEWDISNGQSNMVMGRLACRSMREGMIRLALSQLEI